MYERQRCSGHHAHVERPAYATSWATSAFHMMVGYDVVFHQCEYGHSIPGLEGLVKNPAQVRTTKWSMKTGLRRICSGDHEHTRLEGSRLGGDHRTGRAENYSEKLADKLTELMMADVSIFCNSEFDGLKC